jgi:hypothetical protein
MTAEVDPEPTEQTRSMQRAIRSGLSIHQVALIFNSTYSDVITLVYKANKWDRRTDT